MAKVQKIENGNIMLDNGITLGRVQHPSFYQTNAFGIIFPKVKVGDDIDIPAEAILTSASGRPYVRVQKTIEQLDLEVKQQEISLKKAQITAAKAVLS